MRKIISLFVMFLLCQYGIRVLADNQMYLTCPNAKPGQTVDLTLNLKNTDPVSIWTCRLYFPEGIVFNQLSVETTSRYPEEPTLDWRTTTDGGTMCTVYGFKGNLTGTDGAIATISISVPEDFAPGNYNIELKQIQLMSNGVELHIDETLTFAWKVLDADTPTLKDNQMYLTGPNAKPGQTVDLTLNLKNTDPVSSWNCKLYLPEGIVFNQMSVDTDRYSKEPEVVDSRPTNDGGTMCSVVCGYNNEESVRTTLTGTDGAIAKISISVPDDFAPGDYNIELKRISIASPDAVSVSLPVNETSTFVWKVLDVDTPTPKDNQMYLTGPNAKPGQTVDLTLNLKNTDPVANWNCKLYLPEGIVFNQLSVNTTNRYPKEPKLYSAPTNDGGTLFVVYDYEGTLSGTDGAIATISVSVPDDFAPGDYNIVLNQIAVGSPDAVSLPVNNTSTFVLKVLDADTPTLKDNQMYLTGPNAKPGQTVDLTLNLKNTDPVSSWNCKLYLPEGIVFNQMSVDTDRYSKEPEVVDSRPTNDGGTMCSVVCGYNNEESVFTTLTGTDGAIAKISISVPENFAPGDYNIELKRISIASPDAVSVSLPVNETSTFAWRVVDTFTPNFYTEQLIVTINGESSEPQEASVVVFDNGDGTIDFVLKNFILGAGNESIPVGNINIENIPVTKGEDGLDHLFFEGSITIQPGDMEGVDMWLGPMLGEIPMKLMGKMNEEKLYVTIDIDMQEALGQTIYVQLGTDDFSTSTHNVIDFADAKVKAICVENWDTNGDGELDEAEAAAVTDLGTVFSGKETITSFNELQYFTGLDCIGSFAFDDCDSLTSVTIPESVTSIGDDAFSGCDNLTSVTIPESVTSIGSYAFMDCYSLTSVIIGNSVTDIGVCAFFHCGSLTSITIPNSVTSIDQRTFWGCGSLTSVTIPNSVTSIGNEAFSFSGLTSITIPGCVTSIGNEAFSYCFDLTSVTISDGVTSIGSYAFLKCIGLTSVTIPNSVTSIERATFAECHTLTSVTIPNSVTSIGEGAFGYCTSLTSVNIPNSVTSIGDSIFIDCNNLTSVTIPESVTSIGYRAFSGCDNLTSIKVETENTIYDSRDDCNAIIETTTNTLITGCQNTVIPENVTSIGNGAFSGCDSLTSVTIPNSVTSIGSYAFEYCSSLTNITSYVKEPFAIEDNVFNGIPYGTATLYVPTGTVDAYKATDGWKNFQNIEEISSIINHDINADGHVDVTDIMTIINLIANDIYDAAADLNKDEFVDVGDIMAVINVIIDIYNNSAGVKAMSGVADTEPVTENNDYLTITNENNIIDIQLDNEFEYSAFQMLVTLPDGVDIDAVKFNSDRLNGFTKFVKKVNKGQYIIIGFSIDGDIITGSIGKILSLNTTGYADDNIIISDPIFSIPEAKSYKLRVDDSYTTNLQGVQRAEISVRGNTLYVHANSDTMLNIYTVSGALYKQKHLHSGVNTITLRRGQYIINNHKVTISK